MAPRISSKVYNSDVIRMMRHGIDTEHFRAEVQWPLGFDFAPTITVTMKKGRFTDDDDAKAEDVMHETLSDELKDLNNRIHTLTYSIEIFAMDRDLVRAGMNPSIICKSCFANVYEKMKERYDPTTQKPPTVKEPSGALQANEKKGRYA